MFSAMFFGKIDFSVKVSKVVLDVNNDFPFASGGPKTCFEVEFDLEVFKQQKKDKT